jgi:hypothetical protein
MSNKTYTPTFEFKVVEGTTLSIDEKYDTFSDVAVPKVMYNEVTVLKSVTDQVVSLGGITTVKYLFIKSDNDLTVNIDGVNLPIKKIVMLHTSATSIKLTNLSSTLDAVVTIRLAGV